MLIKRYRRILRNWLAGQETAYSAIAPLLLPKGFYVNPRTDLVIEGFPRSGNSYLEAYLRLTQRDRLSIAHHTHAAAHVMRSVRLKKPTIVLYREPLNACSSLIIHQPGISTARQSLIEYINFYRKIIPLHEHFLLVEFKIATDSPVSVLRRLNQMYGLNLELPDDHSCTDQETFRLLDELSRGRNTITGASEPYSPFAPAEVSASRALEKERVLGALSESKLRDKRSAAISIYSWLQEISTRQSLKLEKSLDAQ